MTIEPHLESFHVVRLNAKLFPVPPVEEEVYRRYNLLPFKVEANDPESIVKHAANCDALVVVSASLPAEVINKLDRCRVISRLGTGTDKIAVDVATERGILVTNIPMFCVEEQADHTMALLLALERQLPTMAQRMREGAWRLSRQEAKANQRLSGRVLGLVGFGNSARAVARRATGFGLRVIATRRQQDTPDAEAIALGVEMVTLDALVATSDYISLHLPLNDETRHLFDADRLAKMKPGAMLINTSRGAIVDENALVDVLRDGHLRGAGIDTFSCINLHNEVETPPDHPMVALDNVVLTPHVGAYSEQAMADVARGGIDNLVAVLSGYWPPPENVVNSNVTPRDPLAPPTTDGGAAM